MGGYGFEREHRKTYSDDSVYNLLFMAKTSTTNDGERVVDDEDESLKTKLDEFPLQHEVPLQ